MSMQRSLRTPLAAVVSLALSGFLPLFAEEAASSASNGKKFSVHGEVRMRYEIFQNAADFSNSKNGNYEDTYDIAPFRVRFGVRSDLGHDITAFADMQGSGVWGRANNDTGDSAVRDYFGASDEQGTNVDLYQGWVNFGKIGGTNMDLRIGRQEIEFDRGLHFSSQPYYNGISHDGVVAAWTWEKLAVHGLWTRDDELNQFDESLETDNDLLGAHVTVAMGEAKGTDLSYYLFHEINRGEPGMGSGGRTTITTIGARYGRELKGATGMIWNVEGAWQEGDVEFSAASSLDHQAYIFEGMIGYNSDKSGQDRTFWVGLYAATGDSDPNDDKQEAYNPLFTEIHSRLGDSDIVPLANIRAVHTGVNVAFRDNHAFRAEFFQFAKAEEEQATISPVSGVVLSSACIPSGSQNCSDDIGRELDLDYSFRATENLTLGIAWAYFIPGGAIEDEFGTPGSTSTGEHAAQRIAFQARARF